MTSITPATVKDFPLLSEIATATFIESHGHSAPADDIHAYLSEKYNPAAIKEELSDPKNIYHILYYNDQPAGYSKIIFNSPYTGSPLENITKLERIYLLKEFYGLKLGATLLHFNIELAKRNDQTGIWLFTWKENRRAIDFYTKHGFIIIGSHDFKISETHSNPNHLMFLKI